MVAKKKKVSIYEQSQKRLVGSLLVNADDIDSIVSIVSDEDFDDPALSTIYAAMVELARADKAVTAFSVASQLESTGDYENVGGDAFLEELYFNAESDWITSAPKANYASIIKDSSVKRRVRDTTDEAKDSLKYDSGVSAKQVVEGLQNELSEALYSISDETTITKVNKSVDYYLNLIEERRETYEENKDANNGLQGIPSSIDSVNTYTTGWLPGQMITVGARTGVGKALALDTLLPTPDGWTTMGEVAVGDRLIGKDGKPTLVTGVTGVMHDRKCYEVVFSNGQTIIADAEHLWETWSITESTQGNKASVKTTEDILNTLFHEETGHANHSIDTPNAFELKEKELPVDPHTLGFHLEEQISSEHLRASQSQRKALLSGLLDANGEVKSSGKTVLKTESLNHARNTAELARSLGNIVDVDWLSEDQHETVYSGFYVVSFFAKENYFVLDRRNAEKIEKSDVPAERFYITDIRPVESVPVKCIQVDNDDHLYLASESMIPTHNTVLAVNSATAAARANKSVLFFSLEMGADEIQDRIYSSISSVPMKELKQGNLSDESKEWLKESIEEFRELKISIDTDPELTVDDIRAKAVKQAQSDEGLDFIIIDYLQLIRPSGKFGSRQEAVQDVSRKIKRLAKQLEVPIMILAQLNKKNDDDSEDELPRMDSIRESYAIAQDSDIVVLLHRPKTDSDAVDPKTYVILEKNRNGESDKVIVCRSDLACSKFEEIRRGHGMDDEDMSDSIESGIDDMIGNSLDDSEKMFDDFENDPEPPSRAVDDMESFDDIDDSFLDDFDDEMPIGDDVLDMVDRL